MKHAIADLLQSVVVLGLAVLLIWRRSQLARARTELVGWQETAAVYAKNADYYRGLVVQCGEALGDNAKTADDGKLGPEVLCAKVPELVKQLVSENEDLALK